MDLRGKPSTFSAEGTKKPVVGEDGLEGGSLVVSMACDQMDERSGDGWMDGRRDAGAGRLSARERANGVYEGDGNGGDWRNGWLSGLTIDRDEEALRGGGGRGGAEGKEDGYFVGVQSVPCYGPRRLSQSPTGSGSSSIPKIFSLFLRTDANITCVSSLWRSSPHR